MLFYIIGEEVLSTPHARGSTAAGRVSDRQAHVYPACAGIHLKQRNRYQR